jgi:hypothetical protein
MEERRQMAALQAHQRVELHGQEHLDDGRSLESGAWLVQVHRQRARILGVSGLFIGFSAMQGMDH